MAAPFLLALHGELTVVGKSPDGDSMRFIPKTPALLDELARADRKRITVSDGSVQRRTGRRSVARCAPGARQGRARLYRCIDTPETHFGKFAQPLGDSARAATGCSSTPALRTSPLTPAAR